MDQSSMETVPREVGWPGRDALGQNVPPARSGSAYGTWILFNVLAILPSSSCPTVQRRYTPEGASRTREALTPSALIELYLASLSANSIRPSLAETMAPRSSKIAATSVNVWVWRLLRRV